MNLEEQLRSYRLPEPPAALETRILAEFRARSEENAAPSWMRSPAWAAGFAVLILLLAAWMGAPEGQKEATSSIGMTAKEVEQELAAVLAEESARRRPSVSPVERKPEARIRLGKPFREREGEYAT